MFKIFYKQNDDDDSLSLVLCKENCNCSIVFDAVKFVLTDNSKIDFNEFELLKTEQTLVSLDEIRNEDFDVFYIKMNDELIFQISWIPYGKQQLIVYDKSMVDIIPFLNKTVYESAVSRFLEADEYEDLLYPFYPC